MTHETDGTCANNAVEIVINFNGLSLRNTEIPLKHFRKQLRSYCSYILHNFSFTNKFISLDVTGTY